MISLDARPSDSIAIALRADASIFAHEELLEVAEDEKSAEFPLSGEGLTSSSNVMGPEELEEHLRRLNPEDFGRFIP